MFLRAWTVSIILVALLIATPTATLQAASSYADPAFKAQWDAGEAITPNFWGPLANAKDGQQEDYKESQGGKRLVQYFDKGRMELTNGKVTNGLLATEIVKGQVQVGDATFTGKAPPAIAIAGDPDGGGPTYATLATKASSLLASAQPKTGSNVTATVSGGGDVTNGSAAATAETTVSGFDDATKHNVPRVFGEYRGKAGLGTIGYAISEAFVATVKVGGVAKPVMVQVFERRVLTYTAGNPDAFKVEMGNIGQHYQLWRDAGDSAAPGAPTTPAPGLPVPPAPPIDNHGIFVVGADTYQLTAAVTPERPPIDKFATVTATLTKNGQGVADAVMETTWHLTGADVTWAFGRSADDGKMSCDHLIDRARPGIPVRVEVYVSYKDQLFTTTTTFVPKVPSS